MLLAQVVGFLPLVWEMKMEFLAPGFSQSQLW